MARRGGRPKTIEQHAMELQTYLTRRGPGDEEHAPTPERVAKAKVAGELVRANVIYTEAGFPTGNFYWSITPVIDDLKRRGTLTEEEYEAAFRFLRHWHNSMHRGAPTSKITPRYDGDVSDLTPTERQWHYSGLARRAWDAMEPLYQPALAWLIQSMGDPVPLRILGEYYSPGKGAQTQTSQGAMALRFACIKLCDFYHIDHGLSRARIEKLSEVLLADLTATASVFKKLSTAS
jgi:hypothetical protein